ncbi:Uncharacterised protein [Chryseobacterium carnipullorum]|uniref:Uncharacterized protein n=1 Tax=Chryseobacterium carnipullorum TaxID=1124835 RepID=A0A376DV45_CHRCU|nr:Uncharacterised protein [Chryseobacterium carnipullorum]
MKKETFIDLTAQIELLSSQKIIQNNPKLN